MMKSATTNFFGAAAIATVSVLAIGSQVTPAEAASLVTNGNNNGNKVVGIDALQIGSTVYNVSFERANFNSLFGDPTKNNFPKNKTFPTFWKDQTGAEAAVSAINSFLLGNNLFNATNSSFLGNQTEYFVGYDVNANDDDEVLTVLGKFMGTFSSPSWTSTLGVGNEIKGGGQDQFIYATFKDTTQVPTPALLPGLIGMGVAAMRKRRNEGESIQ